MRWRDRAASPPATETSTKEVGPKAGKAAKDTRSGSMGESIKAAGKRIREMVKE
jgi:hypothetical protein